MNTAQDGRTDDICEDAREADMTGEKSDTGRKPDALRSTVDEALTGSNGGSDTLAGSLRGGTASGHEDDSDQKIIDKALREQGEAMARQGSDPRRRGVSAEQSVTNTGEDDTSAQRGADAATG